MPFDIIANTIDRDILCEVGCKTDACIYGCTLWNNSTLKSCSDRCNNTGQFDSAFKVNYCTYGCNYAVNLYAEHIIDSIQDPTSPWLVADSLSNTSLQLKWDSANNDRITYLIQWKYQDIASLWTYYQMPKPLNETSIIISDLHPYMTYLFRVVWVVTVKHTFPSPASFPITTLPSGVPSQSPSVIELTSPSHSTIYVSWKELDFTNGPLIHYRVSIIDVLAEQHTQFIKDISPNLLTYTFTSLKSQTLYEIHLSAGNADGQGPITLINMTTMSPPNDTNEAALLVASDDILYSALYEQLSEFPIPIKQVVNIPDGIIQAISVHYWKDLYYVSDNDGNIYVHVSMTNETNFIIYTGSDNITSLSVDWLNNLLYFVESYQILRCDLFGENVEILPINLTSIPSDLLVDPHNGYLYWTQAGDGHGIYRMDLMDITTPDTTPDLIVAADGISTITADVSTFTLFYSNTSNTNFISTFLDGEDIQSFHADIVHSELNGITSVVYYNDRLTWAVLKRSEIYTEEYTGDIYFHSPITCRFVFEPRDAVYMCNDAVYNDLDVRHSSAQPHPVPLTSPSQLQVLFTEFTATITCHVPMKLDFVGRGAWQQWLYEIHIMTSHNTSVIDTDTTVHTVDDLSPSTTYTVKVRAYSPGGYGPWSKEFTGQTLKAAELSPYIVIATQSSLSVSSLNGEQKEEVYSVNRDIADIDWFEDSIYWSTSDGSVYYMNKSCLNDSLTKVELDTVKAIAVDWFSGMLYWVNHKHSVIYRSLVFEDGTLFDTEHVMTSSATDLAIDSMHAYLYWTTLKTVECSRLNGDNHFTYQTSPDFSGETIIGLTLNFDDDKLYWFVHTSLGLQLYQSDLAHRSVHLVATVKKLFLVNSSTMTPALHYYSNRLFWLNEYHHVVISTLSSDDIAVMPFSNEVFALGIIQSTLHPVPGGYEDRPQVVPHSILSDSVNIEGSWDNFLITWQPSNEVNYGTVYYEIVVKYDNTQVFKIVTQPYYHMTEVDPFIQLNISLAAYTYWATSQTVHVIRSSPMSVPSIPENCRYFTTVNKDIYKEHIDIFADIRWETPTVINGLLLGYHIYVSLPVNDTIIWYNMTVGSDVNRYILPNLTENSIYNVQIDAFTAIGNGESSQVMIIDTQVEKPAPKLLVVENDGIMEQDVDSGNTNIISSTEEVLFVGYIFHSSQLLWVDADTVYLDSKQLVSGLSVPQGFAVDWIGQAIYWTQNDNTGGSIHYYNLNSIEQIKTTEIVKTVVDVGQIVVDPYHSTILWIEETEISVQLMKSGLHGERPAVASNGRRHRDLSEHCNCQANITIGHVFTIDQSDANNPWLYWSDGNEGHLWRSDTAICQCQKLFDVNSHPKSGLPPDSLTVDHQSVYWTNDIQGLLNSVDKDSGDNFQSHDATGISVVLAYGSNLQPMPDLSCLSPEPYNNSIINVWSGRYELTLSLIPTRWPAECVGLSKATLVYTLYYAPVDSATTSMTCDNGLSCKTKESEDTNITISDLQPYTYYVVQVAVSNIYTQTSQQLSKHYMYATQPGVPSMPLDVRAEMRTAIAANITWLAPMEPRGPLDEIQYELLYSTDGSSWSIITSNIGHTVERYYIYLYNLQPAMPYTFKVRAYPALHDEYTESLHVENTTFQVPGPVTLLSKTDTTLNISWTSPTDGSVNLHVFKYQKPGEVLWQTQILPGGITESNVTYYELIGSDKPLQPKTLYRVQVAIIYHSHEDFEWPEHFRSFETLAGLPDIPEIPYFKEYANGIWQVEWMEPENNGAEILNYDLQYLRMSQEYNITSNWTTAYNETDAFWVISDLEASSSYKFRVCAINEIGQSDFSGLSELFNVTKEMPTKGDSYELIIIIAAAVVALVIIVIILLICLAVKKRKEKQTQLDGEVVIHFDPDQELATLRAYPNNTIRQSNWNYGNLDLNVELPLFPRERLKLVTFLGSGAFGEVFEGLALDIMGDNSGETKVAVKTLRKGATDQEKEEFLKEAQLMSNFNHPNILHLLGVCLDNDPQFIILELMGAGDLLSYLRSCRHTAASPASLGCLDLLEISVDVCRGCKYLEEMHFVHRDLAARNCLVTGRDPRFRVVKIGDFGLARDIYKNDYYRKEGEGLLPVRWMSPESLVDGIFTIQSDIWAFGVLLWEVMTLGQQPYPARTNLEVCHFVTSGGRLDRPDNCPDDVHQLMLKCWHNDPDCRPTFRYLLGKLEAFKRKSISPEHGLDNLAFDDSPVNYSRIKQGVNSTEDEEGYLEPVNSKQSLRSRGGSYRTELLGSPSPKPSPLLGKKLQTNTPQGSPRLASKFPALENPLADRERCSHNSRYAMDTSITPRETPRGTPSVTPITNRKVCYHDNKAFLADEETSSGRSSLSKASVKNLLFTDSGKKPSSLSKAAGAAPYFGKDSQPDSLSKATAMNPKRSFRKENDNVTKETKRQANPFHKDDNESSPYENVGDKSISPKYENVSKKK